MTCVPVDVRDRKQLFVDDRWFDQCRGVRLTVNPPQSRRPIDWPVDQDDEGRGVHAYLSVLEADGRYRMWYDSRPAGASTRQLMMRYAESDDGLTWRKPELDLFDLPGVVTRNVVMPGTYGSVMHDPLAPEPHRYKALCNMFPTDAWPQARGVVHGEKQPDGTISFFMATYLLTSPDGLQWTRQEKWASPYFHDSQNQLLFDRRLQSYVAYFRWLLPGRPRCAARIEVPDPMALPWSFRRNPASVSGPGGTLSRVGDECDPIIYTDPGSIDPPEVDVYCPCVTQYPWADDTYYLSFMPLYRHYTDPVGDAHQDTAEARALGRPVLSNDGPIDVRVATSADGIAWRRPDYSPFLRLGLDWDSGCLYMAPGMIRRGDTIWQYYVGFPVTHGHNTGGRVGVAISRLDGFVSADADYAGGAFTTPALQFTGSHLEVNVDCSALGQLRVELRDEGQRPIPGYELANCVPVDRNHIAARVRWRGMGSVAALVGRPVRLHVEARDCKLYAFQFTAGAEP